jgi:hypothetical protein
MNIESEKTITKDDDINTILDSGFNYDIVPIGQLPQKLKVILVKYFYQEGLGIADWEQEYLNELRTDILSLVEFPYNDKVYRDDFYHYFSTKHRELPRNAIRVSLFEKTINLSDFRNSGTLEKLQESYLGFIIIRPTEPNLTGRSIIHPKALKNNNFRICCSNEFSSAINCIKLSAEGFPHASQNEESTTCAETSVWALMEYFGFKYAEYRPLLPSQIRRILSKQVQERQLPSRGLNTDQISYVLKKMGFGVKTYERNTYGDREFNRIIAYHVESGIPVVASIFNDNIGHAVLIVGHEELKPYSVRLCQVSDKSPSGMCIYDTAEVPKQYVFIDDNSIPYKLGTLDEPLKHYNNSLFQGVKIENIIVPLYHKVYNDAEKARNFCLTLINDDFFRFKEQIDPIVFRFFLASSRSFKNKIANDSSFGNLIKEIILRRPMPKFIWVAEITDKNSYEQKKALGMIILDATEANHYSKKALLFTLVNNKMVVVVGNELKTINDQKIEAFEMYSNLKLFENANH